MYVSAELSPYASTGGLGEVGRSLPKALADSGAFEVQRVMPCYKWIDKDLQYRMDYPVPMDIGYETCIVRTDPGEEELPTYFISNDRYFYRDNIYAYDDDGFRFFFFCRAVIELLKRLPDKPDIIHTNDWHCGFLPLLVKKELPGIKTVYTIHNIGYHGYIPSSYLNGYLDKREEIQLGYPEWLNFMKAGIIYADLVTTVSPGYRKEILKPDKSFGMHRLLKERKNDFVGILNGIDTDSYDPKKKDGLEYPYDSKNLKEKKKSRALLREAYGLADKNIPLVAMVTRLDYTKGMDVLIKAISYADFRTFQLIILGSGNPYYQGILESVAAGYQGKLAFDFHYTPELAKKIYAAADLYLMPSVYEPCGLGQLYAMRYGAVPIVNPVGGLRDTVRDNTKEPEKNTGFYMEEWTGEALIKAIKRAVKVYHSKEWDNLVRNCMKYNSTWKKSVRKYARYYEQLMKENEPDNPPGVLPSN